MFTKNIKIFLIVICFIISALILIHSYALGYFITDAFLSEINKRGREQWSAKDNVNITDIVEKYIPKGSKKEVALNFLKERKFSVHPQSHDRWDKDEIGKYDEIIICSTDKMNAFWFLLCTDEIRIIVYIRNSTIVEKKGILFLLANAI